MPRPHALPRKSVSPSPAPHPGVPLVQLPVREVTAVGVLRGHKALFDELHAWLSYHEGRSLVQPEAFAILLDVALKSGDPRLVGFEPRSVSVEVAPAGS